MLPLRLEIKNFLAYRAPDPVRFDGIHLACLTGANGAGKSSLLDAITWALWGKARAKRDEELIHLRQSDMYVQLDFEQEGINYRVIRRRSRKSNSGSLDLFAIEDDGNLNTLSEPNMRGTQEKINRLLRLDYETFVHSAFLQQGKADAFTTKTPKDRKQILTDILGLSRWEKYETGAKNRIKTANETIAVYENRVREIDTELAQEPQIRARLAQAEEAQHAAAEALSHAEGRLKEVEHATRDLQNTQKDKADKENRLREYERDWKMLEDDRIKRETRVAEFEQTLAHADEIEHGYAVLQAARQDDQALGSKLKQLSDFDARRHELQRQLDAARAELIREAAGYESTIKEKSRAINNAKHDELTQIQAQIAELAGAQSEYDAAQTERANLSGEKGELKFTNNSLRDEMNAMDDRLGRLNSTSGATCPLCGQPMSEEARLDLITQIKAEGKEKGDTFRANKARMKDIDETISANQALIETLEGDLRRRLNLEAKASALQVGVDEAHAAQLELNELDAQLASIRATVDAEDYGAELRDQLAALDQEREAIGYDGERHTTAQQELQHYVEFESQKARLELASQSLPDARDALQLTLNRITRLEGAQAEENAALEEIALEIARLKVLVEEQKIRQEEVNRQRTLERNASETLTIAKQNLSSLDALRTRRADVESRLSQTREDKAVYEELRQAFGKNGIPAMIIETAIPELESQANYLLSRMTDGRMSLTIPTQRDKITGGVAETLDINISDELGTRSYEMFSGGEAFRIDFALRVALSQMLARRAGAQLRTLFIDEGFGTQDEDGRNKLTEAINAIQEQFDMILVITHIDDLRDAFPVHIAIDKTPEGSRISVR